MYTYFQGITCSYRITHSYASYIIYYVVLFDIAR